MLREVRAVWHRFWEQENTQQGDLDCPRTSIAPGYITQEPAVCPHYIPLFSLSHLPAWFIHVNQLLQNPFFRKVLVFSAKLSCCEGFLRERCLICRCTFSPEERIGFPWEGWSSYLLSPGSDSHRQTHTAWQYSVLQGFLGDTPCSLAILK